MSAHQNPPRRPRLSLQTSTIADGPNFRRSSAVAATVNPTSPTAFNTLSNVFVTAIDRATPVTAIDTTQSRMQTQTSAQVYRGSQTPHPSPYSDMPLAPHPLCPQTVGPYMQFSNITTLNPPLSSGLIVDSDPKLCAFSAADTAGPSSALAPMLQACFAVPSAPLVSAVSLKTTTTTTTTTTTASSLSSSSSSSPLPATTTMRTQQPGSICRPAAASLRIPGPNTPLPYVRNRSLHSILRNSPLPPPTAKTPTSPRRQSLRLAEEEARRVGYESPIERIITTNHYVRAHIDLFAEEASPEAPASPPPPECQARPEVMDLAMAGSGDRTRDGRQTPGLLEDMRRRMVGLSTRTPTSPSTSGIRKRNRGKDHRRTWVWTIATPNDGLDDGDVGGARAAIRPIARAQEQAQGQVSVADEMPTLTAVVGPMVPSPAEVPTPSIEMPGGADATEDVVMSESETEADKADDDGGSRSESLMPGDAHPNYITLTAAHQNHNLDVTSSRTSSRPASEGMIDPGKGTRRDTPIPADSIMD